MLLVDVASDCKLNLADESVTDLGIDQDISCAAIEPVLDPDDVEGIAGIVALVFQSLEQVNDFAFFGDALAPEQVEDLTVYKIEAVEIFSTLFLEEEVGADFVLINLQGNVEEEVDEFVELAADIGRNGTF